MAEKRYTAVVTVLVTNAFDKVAKPKKKSLAKLLGGCVQLDIDTEGSDTMVGNNAVSGVEIDWNTLKEQKRGIRRKSV